jgi:hypothetical protein
LKNLPIREGGGPIFRIEGSGSANTEPGHEPAITGGSHFLRRVGKKTDAGL